MWKKIYNYFYRQESDKSVAVCRIAIAFIVFCHAITWLPWIELFFTENGLFPRSLIFNTNSKDVWSILEYLPDATVYPLYLLLLTATITLAFGIFPRLSCFLLYILFTSFSRRAPHIEYGGYMFLRFALFPMMFLRSDRTLTPKWYQQKYFQPKAFYEDWPLKIIQLEVAYIYLFSAMMKLKEPGWMNGTQMLSVLNLYGVHWNFTWLGQYPLVTAILTFVPMISELCFPFLVWFSQTRRVCIAAVVLMHIGIALTMNVTWLSETMICLLTSFLREEDFELFKNRFLTIEKSPDQ